MEKKLHQNRSGKIRDWVINDNRRKIEEGTHNFLQKDFSKNVQIKRVKNGTHPWLNNTITKQRIKNGTHNFFTKGRVVALNKETNTVSWVPSEIYFQRKDIYFHPNSTFFKQWKKEHARKS